MDRDRRPNSDSELARMVYRNRQQHTQCSGAAFFGHQGDSMKNIVKSALSIVILVVHLFAPSGYAAPFAYIANQNGNSVSVVDLGSNQVTDIVQVESGPFGITVDSSGTYTYIANSTDNSVSVYDISGINPGYLVSVGQYPITVELNQKQTRAYVVNYSSNNVSILNLDTYTISATFEVGRGPADIVVNPYDTRAYVSNTIDNTISVINTATQTAITDIAVGQFPVGLAIDKTGKTIYVTNRNDGTISFINTDSNLVEDTIFVGQTPMGISLSSDGSKLYVGNDGSDTISVIDTAKKKLLLDIHVENNGYIGITPEGTHIIATDSKNDTISVIDTLTHLVTATIAVSDTPIGFGSFITPYTEDIKIKSLTMDIAGTVAVNTPVRVSVNAIGPSEIYYRFRYTAGFGTDDYESNTSVIMQNWTTKNYCDFVFLTADNYIVLVEALVDPNNPPTPIPIIGTNIKVE